MMNKSQKYPMQNRHKLQIYCKNCGNEVYDNYCSSYGTKITPSKLRIIAKCCLSVLLFYLTVCFFIGSVYPKNNESVFDRIFCFSLAALFAWTIYLLWRKKKYNTKKAVVQEIACQVDSANSVQSNAEASPTSDATKTPHITDDLENYDFVPATTIKKENLNPQPITPTYIHSGNTISRTDGEPISDEEVSYLIEMGKRQALEQAIKSHQRSAREEELSFQFFYKHGGESQRLTDIFEDLNRTAYAENNIDKKIELLQSTINAYEKAKKWHYNHSKGGMIYFQDMWECMHNSRNQCFGWDESVRAELDWQLEKRNIIIPWILENASDGFLQTNIYKEFPDENKADLRKTIDELVSELRLTKTKKGNSYFIKINDNRNT